MTNITREKVIGRGYILVKRCGSAVHVYERGGPVYESVVDAYNALLYSNDQLEILEVELTNLGRWNRIESKKGASSSERTGRAIIRNSRSF